jgi:hypothetical protein
MAGEIAQAERYFELAFEFFERSGLPDYAWDPRAGLARCHLHQGRLSEAETCARRLWQVLGERSGKGMEFPILAFTTCGRVFAALGDHPRAAEVVWRGYQELNQRLNQIEDQAWRKAFLENVSENRELTELWQVYPQEV